jgi:CheY-like chemotaxis protein
MTQPLALLLYEKLLPGTQLVNRLQDLGWRVQTLHDAVALARSAEEHKPMIVLTDLAMSRSSAPDSISELRRNQNTAHIPVIAFSADASLHAAATSAGANLVVSDAAVLQHLDQFIEQALTDFS